MYVCMYVCMLYRPLYIDSEITYIAVLTHSLALLHLAGAHKHTLNSSSSEVISEMIKK